MSNKITKEKLDELILEVLEKKEKPMKRSKKDLDNLIKEVILKRLLE